MANIISSIFSLIMVVFFFIGYIKSKKMSFLLATIIGCIAVYFKTPFASALSKTFENIIVGIVALLAITIFYLLVKEDKKKDAKK
ncbi:hypothetical protein [Clostridium sp.]|uniref:hypothetical protein n=1 Tax=Clostridium sp. TaxID=1506 RepID=UPI003D6D74C8